MQKRKKKGRHVLITILIYCEGDCEYVFLNYLKKIFHKRESGFIITIKKGQGGSPKMLVKKTNESDGFDQKYIWVDTDREEINEARDLAEKTGIILFENIPCLEGEILKIYDKNKRITNYKSAFVKKYPNENLCEEKTYSKLFPKKIIYQIKNNKNCLLSRIIELIEAGK